MEVVEAREWREEERRTEGREEEEGAALGRVAGWPGTSTTHTVNIGEHLAYILCLVFDNTLMLLRTEFQTVYVHVYTCRSMYTCNCVYFPVQFHLCW